MRLYLTYSLTSATFTTTLTINDANGSPDLTSYTAIAQIRKAILKYIISFNCICFKDYRSNHNFSDGYSND